MLRQNFCLLRGRLKIGFGLRLGLGVDLGLALVLGSELSVFTTIRSCRVVSHSKIVHVFSTSLLRTLFLLKESALLTETAYRFLVSGSCYSISGNHEGVKVS